MTSDPSKEIFLDALDIAPGDRSAFIDQRCADDQPLRTRVELLLGAHEKAQRIIIEPTAHGWAEPVTVQQTDTALLSGESVGPYVIERLLGEGGFGTVYLAQQRLPVQRRVALKIIRPGMDSRDIIRRFEIERQALAVMNHPGIAKVFDAGTTPGGRPYFVMEFVEGKPITEFCDDARLSIRQRLELFEDVCLAIQHAHSKGVIHRDLKPSNVLISIVDGRPFPKVIDFGIAKAMHEPLGGHQHALTLPQQIIGTPQYMAPEQATLDDIDVDTRSDVYSLGVILYELLVGTPVFDAARLRGVRPSELERIICEEEPPRPSARAEALPEDKLNRIAAARSLEPASRLARALHGDLDWICLRAMEKDRARRYAAALALAADVRRYLHDEPVEASPPTLSYRVSKFARRHRVEFAAGAAVAMALVAFACGSAWFAFREHRAAEDAKQQLARANALATFSQDILAGVDPAEARGLDTALLRKILSRAAERVQSSLSDQPDAAASMFNAIGYAYMQIGDIIEAERRFRQGLKCLDDAGITDSDGALQTRENLGAALTELSKFDEAEPLLKELLETRRRLAGPEADLTLIALGNLGYLYDRSGRSKEAGAVFDELLAIRLRTVGPDHESTLTAMNNLANVLDDLGERDRAIEMFEKVVRGHVANHGETWPKALLAMNNLATSYRGAGRLKESRDLYSRVLDLKRQVHGPEHASTIITINNLAGVELDLGEIDSAEKRYQEALDITRRTMPKTDLRIVAALNGLANVYRKRNQPQLAEPRVTEAIEIVRAGAGPKHPSLVVLCGNLAAIRMDIGDAAGAEQAAREAIELANGSVGTSHESIVKPTTILAKALAAQHRAREAATILQELLERQPPPPMTDEDRHDIVATLIEYHQTAGDSAAADRWRKSLTTRPSDRAK